MKNIKIYFITIILLTKINTVNAQFELDVFGDAILRDNSPNLSFYNTEDGEIKGTLREEFGDIDLITRRGNLKFWTGIDGISTLIVTILGSNGNVGIGTNMPISKLDVKGTATVGQPGDGNTLLTLNSERSWAFKQVATEEATRLVLQSVGGGGNKNFVISTQGDVGIGNLIPTHPLHMQSGAHVTTGGNWTNASSRSLKENISNLTLEEATLALAELTPVKFNYKLQKDEEYIGFIAEDVPDLVATGDRLGLSPMDIIAVLTKVVQEQQSEIADLKVQSSEVNNLKREMAELKALLNTQIINSSEE